MAIVRGGAPRSRGKDRVTMEALLFILLLLALLAVPVLMIVLLVQIGRLRRDLQGFRVGLPAPRPPAPPPRPEPVLAPLPAAPVEIDGGTPAPATPPAPPASAKLDGKRLESVIGERWLVRVGAVVLVLGLGFLYKYSVEHGWVPPIWRVIGGGLGGLLIWTLGSTFLRQGRQALGQGFIGCGSAVLYLTTFAAQTLYGFLPPGAAFAAMVAVTAVTVVLALRHEALSLAILAQTGGFLTPVLVGIGHPDPHLLFAYLLLLDAGLLYVAVRRSWSSMIVLGWLGTGLLATLWSAATGIPDAWTLAGWLTALAALFATVLARRLGDARAGGAAWCSFACLNTAAWAVGAWVALGSSDPRGLGILLAGFGLGQLGLATWSSRRGGQAEFVAWLQGIGCTLLLLAPWQMFTDPRWMTVAYVVLGVGLAALARLRPSPTILAGGMAALAVAAVRVVAVHFRLQAAWWEAFRDADFTTSLFVVAGVFLAGLTARAHRGAWYTVGSLLLLTVLGREVGLAFTQHTDPGPLRIPIHLTVWAVTSAVGLVAFAVAAARERSKALANIVLDLGVVAAILAVEVVPYIQVPPGDFVLNGRFLPLLLIPVGLALSTRFLGWTRGGAKDTLRGHRIALTCGALGLPLLLLLVEGYRYFSRQPTTGGLEAGQAALTIIGAVYAAGLLVLGTAIRKPAIRLAALGLLALTLVKLAAVDLAFLEQVYRIITFILLGVILMSGAWLYSRFNRRLFAGANGASAQPGASSGERPDGG